MRLSEAILLGRVTMHKTFPGHLDGCALGMAANARGILRDYLTISTEWPWLNERRRPPCGCNLSANEGTFLTTTRCITHLFDSHVVRNFSWTFEQLVDWVRSVEPAEPEGEHFEIEAKETGVNV